MSEPEFRPTREAAERLLDKLRAFVAGLDDEEGALFAALIAPGIAQPYLETDEVSGFAAGVEWTPARLPDALADAVRGRRITVEGL